MTSILKFFPFILILFLFMNTGNSDLQALSTCSKLKAKADCQKAKSCKWVESSKSCMRGVFSRNSSFDPNKNRTRSVNIEEDNEGWEVEKTKPEKK